MGSPRLALAALALVSLGGCDRVKGFASPPPPPAPPACAPAPSAPPPTADGALAVLTSSPAAVRDALSKRVHGERATPEDARLLLALCTNLHDDACVADCDAILAPRDGARGAPPAVDEAPPAGAPRGGRRGARRSVSEQARAALLTSPQTTKELLMPLVVSGKGSADDVRTLRAACDALKDLICVEYLKGK